MSESSQESGLLRSNDQRKGLKNPVLLSTGYFINKTGIALALVPVGLFVVFFGLVIGQSSTGEEVIGEPGAILAIETPAPIRVDQDHEVNGQATEPTETDTIGVQGFGNSTSLTDTPGHPVTAAKDERPERPRASSVVITNAWPQILLGNEIRFNNGGTIMGISGFLVKLPGETILGVVPLDTLEPAGFGASSLQRLNGFSDAVDSWKMYPRYDPGQSIAFEGVYDRYKKIHPKTADYRDYLLISFIGDRIDIPSIPLEIAKAKPEIDQPVFVLSVSNSEEFLHQTVYSAMVSAYDKSKAMLVVTIELPLGSERMKSMPVLTTRGELLGIISNHRPRPIGRVRENTVQLLAHFAGAILNSETDSFNSPALISSAGSEE